MVMNNNIVKNVIIFFIFFSISFLHGQNEEIKIEFDNYSPVWIHISKDNSIVDYMDSVFSYTYNGLDHFHPQSLSYVEGKHMFISYTHFISNSQTGTLGAYIGFYIEKIDLRSGEVTATAYSDLRNNAQREIPIALFPGQNGTLEVINMRHTGSLSDPLRKGTLSVFRYDTADLSLKERFFAKANDAGVKIFNLPISTRAPAVVRVSDNDIYSIMEKEIAQKNGKNLYSLRLLELDEKGIVLNLSEDTRELQAGHYSWTFDNDPFRINSDTICHPVFLNVLNPDSIYAAFRFYDRDLNYLGETDLKDLLVKSHIPYQLESKVQNHWIMKGSFSKDFFPIFNRSFYHFSSNGKILEYYDISNNYPNPAALKLVDNPGFLIMGATESTDTIDVFKTNGAGTMYNVRSFTFSNEYRLAPIRMTQLENGDVIMFAHILDTMLSVNNSLAKAVVRFKAGDLDIPTDTKDIVLSKTIPYSLYPNPADRSLILTFDKSFTGKIEIVDFLGVFVAQYYIIKQKSPELDIQNLSPGPYLLRVFPANQKQLFEVERFIKN